MPIVKPTPADYVVLIVFVSVVLIIGGIVALVIGYREPPDQHELAAVLEYRGAWCLGIGVVIPLVIGFCRRLMD